MARVRHVGSLVALFGFALGCAEDGAPRGSNSGSGGSASGAAGSAGSGGGTGGNDGAGGSSGGGSSGSSNGGASGAAGSAGESGVSGSAGSSGAGSDTDGGVGDATADAGQDGATNVCEPASRAVVLATIGDLPCTALITCLETSCDETLESAVGENFEQGDYSGGICEDYVNCIAACDCESECGADCRSQFVSVGGPCLDAMSEISLCRMDLCQPQADLCED